MKDDKRETGGIPSGDDNVKEPKPKTEVDFSQAELNDPATDPNVKQKSICPQCHMALDDPTGMGITRHEECGYCSHPKFKDGKPGQVECIVCGFTVRIVKCYKCHKELTDRKRGNSIVAVQFNAYTDNPGVPDDDMDRFTKNQELNWGKYWNLVTRTEGVSFCFECYIKALLNIGSMGREKK